MVRRGRLIGLLTGTFDPVHLGHVAMARAAMAACELDEVWFLVNPEPGHKVGVTELSDRVAMVKLAVEREPGLRLYSGNLAGKSHNIDVFLTMISQYPTDKFVFITGTDVLERLRLWDDYERVMREVRFAMARRRGSKMAVDERLRVQWFDLDERIGASSRDIRGELKSGRMPADLDERVYEYIRDHGLYT